MAGSLLAKALCPFENSCKNHEKQQHRLVTSISTSRTPFLIVSSRSNTEAQSAFFTDPPMLSLRNAVPNPQIADSCQQAEQSASQAIQQASQQASQSIQQASQQALQAAQQASQQLTQSIAQASRSASGAIQQAQQSASQSIADAQRSVSSATSALESVQASAASAISLADRALQSAQISASAAQSIASAIVAAATGSVAAAGSSFLAAAARVTQSAQLSVSALDAAASSQVAQVTASQTQAVTATQVALAIVGSIIASALIAILLYLLFVRRKNAATRKLPGHQSSNPEYTPDLKFPINDQVGSTNVAPQRNCSPAEDAVYIASKSLSNQQHSTSGLPVTKVSELSWDSANPSGAPKSWLRLQDAVSPFRPISLHAGGSSEPLGGQLKSPYLTVDKGLSLQSQSTDKIQSPTVPIMIQNNPPVVLVNIPPKRTLTSARRPADLPSDSKFQSSRGKADRGIKASIWANDILENELSPISGLLPRTPTAPMMMKGGARMVIPSPKNPRSTAEWLAERALSRVNSSTTTDTQQFSGFGLPQTPKASRTKSLQLASQ